MTHLRTAKFFRLKATSVSALISHFNSYITFIVRSCGDKQELRSTDSDIGADFTIEGINGLFQIDENSSDMLMVQLQEDGK